MAENDGRNDSFQVKFPNVFTNYPLGAVRVEDQRFKVGTTISLLYGNRN